MSRYRAGTVVEKAKLAGSKQDNMLLPDGVWEDEKQFPNCSNRLCGISFSFTVHKHHCRYCGQVFCAKCAPELPLMHGTPLQKGKKSKARRCNSCKLPIIFRAYRHTMDGPLNSNAIETIMSYLDNKSHNALLQSCRRMQETFHIRRVKYFEHIRNRFPTAFVGAQVGKGACGTVLMVEDRMREDRMKVALKIVPKHTIYAYNVWGRLFDEMTIMGENNHANVCQMLEVIQTLEELVIVMECGEGGTLKHAYERLKKMKVSMEIFAAHVAAQVSAGLEYLYKERNVVHRDLKVENVVVSRDFSRVMIIDFGLAAILKDKTTPQRFVACGTPGYASPENIQPVVVKRSTYFSADGAAMHAADMFSLGVIVFMILSNSKPLTGKKFPDMWREMQNGLRAIGPRWNDVSKAAKDVVEGLLITKTEDRWTPEMLIQHQWISDTVPKFHNVADEIQREWERQEKKINDEFDVVELDDGFHLVDEDEFDDTFEGTRRHMTVSL